MTTPDTITSEIQKLEPSAIVELFEMDATAFGGDLLRFHAGTNGLRQNLVWQGNTYTAFPIKASGFDVSGNGQLPRPKLQVANVTGAITLLVLTYDDLLGAKITRKRTLAKYLDAVNFPGGTNPTADDTAEFADDIFFVDRKVAETRDVVEFELAAAFDVAGVQLPRRQIIQNVCVWRYRGGECGWTTPEPRRNLLRYSDQFDNSAWAKIRSGTGIAPSVTANAGTAPNGTLTAELVTLNRGAGNTSSDFSVLNQSAIPTTTGASYIGSIYVKAATAGDVGKIFLFRHVAGSGYLSVTLTADWVRISKLENAFSTSSSIEITSRGSSAANAVSFYLWGAQLEAGSTATTYQSIGASYTNPTYYDANDDPVASLGQDFCGKRLSSCKARFGANSPLPFGSFPAAGLTR